MRGNRMGRFRTSEGGAAVDPGGTELLFGQSHHPIDQRYILPSQRHQVFCAQAAETFLTNWGAAMANLGITNRPIDYVLNDDAQWQQLIANMVECIADMRDICTDWYINPNEVLRKLKPRLADDNQRSYTVLTQDVDIPPGSRPGNFPIFVTSDLRHNSDVNALASIKVFEKNFYSNMHMLVQDEIYTQGRMQYGCTENELNGQTVPNQLNTGASNGIFPGWGLTCSDGNSNQMRFPNLTLPHQGFDTLTNESGLIPFWNRRTQVWINEYTNGRAVTPYPPAFGREPGKPNWKKTLVTATVDGFGFWEYHFEEVTFKNHSKFVKGQRQAMKQTRLSKVQKRKQQIK